MKKHHLLILFVFLGLISCNRYDKPNVSFYHWKSKAKNSAETSQCLLENRTDTIYMHFFDVDEMDFRNPSDNIYPTYVLREVDDSFKEFNIVPVVFITNQVLRQNANIPVLARQIRKLIDEISFYHFYKKAEHIQLDCDWNQSTHENYFSLIEHLNKHYSVSATIRLHQIKYQNKTGVPPVNHATLMLYNMGDLSDFDQNSIIDNRIVASYIDAETRYPIKLNVALPLFSQTVLRNNEGKLKLINEADKETVTADQVHFAKISETVFDVKKDTLLKGFYLSEGYSLKFEESTEEEIIKSYKLIKNSKLDYSGVVFYHLDDAVLSTIDVKRIIKSL